MEPIQDSTGARREVATRKTGWAMKIARHLANRGIQPNTISVASIGFAMLAGICFGFSTFFRPPWCERTLLIFAIVFMQLRLLCNLFDGMVAVECGMKTRSGEIFNDLPDRIADPMILIGVGYAIRQVPFGVELGWLAALMAIFTAYVRVLGASAGAKHFFLGPMAKQHRMAVMTLAALTAAVLLDRVFLVLTGALGLVIVGCLVTILRRVKAIVNQLESCDTKN